MNSGWYVVIGAVIGLLGSFLGSWVTESRLDRRAERHRKAEREQRRDDLQRDTLIALQDALLRVVRAAMRHVLHDIESARNGAPWGTVPARDDLGRESMTAFQDAALLAARVLDDDVRARVEETTAAASRIVLAQSQAQSQQIEGEMTDAYRQATERVGVVLRATF